MERVSPRRFYGGRFTRSLSAVSGAMTARRFPAPWSVEKQPECVKSFAEQHGRMQWPGRGRNQSKERKKLVKKLAKR
jgi:hypothetical protein